jgi:multidrug efflux system membrane fusion protein
MTLALETLPKGIGSVGSLKAVQEVVVAPEVGGRVAEIGFHAGDQVEAGALLLKLVSDTEEAELASAMAQQRFAALQLERSQKLTPNGTESRQSLQQREVENDQAVAQVELVRARLAQKSILAPFAGTLGISQINVGAFVNAGQSIATLTAIDKLHVDFSVPQQNLPDLKVGSPIAVTTDVFAGKTFAAVITAIEPVIKADTRNVAVQATLDNADRTLRPGLFVDVNVELPSQPDTIIVPETAIQKSASGDMAYLVKDGVAGIVPVTLGAQVDGRVEVTSGLAPGDELITSGQLRVRPGAPVAIAGAAGSAPAKTW